MRMPQTPPELVTVITALGKERFVEVLSRGPSFARADTRYMHWHDLRRRPAPDGFSHEEWWVALKLGRHLRFIGLRDKQAGAFGFGQPDSLSALLHEIDRGLGAVMGLPEAVNNPAARDRYVVNTLIQESITSSQLEGAVTTREVAKQMLRSGRPPTNTSEKMIVNNYLTMQRIRELGGTSLTPELVFEIHRRVTDGTLEKPDGAGRFRREDENVRVEHQIEGTVFHVPPLAAELRVRLEAMCKFANGDEPDYFVHPIIRAIILHFWLAYDHPFVDGNGRTARALFYWCMLKNEYRLFEFISISEVLLQAPVKYAEAFLYTETDGNDLTYFLLHQAGVIREAEKSLHNYIEQKRKEMNEVSRYLDGITDINHRQQALLTHALKDASAVYQIRAHKNSHHVSYQTARDDLFGLVDKKLLEVSKSGKNYVFRVPLDLSHSISSMAKG